MSDSTKKTLSEAEATAIVNEAIELDARNGERLTVAELEDRVEALGVPRTRIREVLAKRDAEKAAQEKRDAEARKVRDRRMAQFRKYAKVGSYNGGIIAAVIALAVTTVLLSLDGDRNRAAAAQEKVYSALGRQQTVIANAPSISDALNRDAELAGAANRVYVAKTDYDRIVSEYNSDASKMGWFLRVIPILPARLPFAREVWR